MKITIAGYGFVGKAVVNHFENSVNLFDKFVLEIVDPQFEEWNYPISQDTDAVIICVSTPMSEEDGSCYMQNVIDVISDSPDVPILIKSTISLEGWEQIKLLFPKRKISFSPEFLRANTALEDFQNTKYMIIGNDTRDSFWSSLFVKTLACRVHHCTNEEAIIVKYMENSFLAMKVSFFNQVYDLCQKTNTEFSQVRHLLTLDKRINPDHSFVTDERGWWGHCFPKDTSAILHTAKQYDAQLSLIQETVDYNKKLKMNQYHVLPNNDK